MKIRSVLIAFLAFIGMVDALYLSIKRNAGPIPCHVTRGCTDVLTSKYSEVAGIPLSWFGAAFYIAILSLAVFKIFEDPKGHRGHPGKWGLTPAAKRESPLSNNSSQREGSDPIFPSDPYASWIFYLSGAGLIVSALLVGIQAFILKAFCEYCLLSAALVLTIFLLSPHPLRHKPPE